MNEATRGPYLDSIEAMMVRWREWGDDLSARLDALAGGTDEAAFEEIEQHIEEGVDAE
jgi:predicted transcriptional regulator